jgi:hypothetical protein
MKWKEIPDRQVLDREEEDDPWEVWTRRKGTVQFADGTKYAALLEFCESDSNEHYGTVIMKFAVPKDDGTGWGMEGIDLGDDDCLKRLGKTKQQVFPYRYKYEGTPCDDHHIGGDGWSI